MASSARSAVVHFHSPCFDGIASAVLALDWLEEKGGWGPCDLVALGAEARKGWLSSPLPPRSAVVDFPYHPDAAFWADHHQTAFLSPTAEAHARARPPREVLYDAGADSCAGVLWRRLQELFGHRNPAYRELVGWAEKIDGARYDSVDEALDGRSPALVIAASLTVESTPSDSVGLVRALRTSPLEDVAERDDVRRRARAARELQDAGLARMESSVTLSDAVALFDVDARGVLVNRYAPYRFFPDADYSLGILRDADGTKITAMRNPWREFESVALGRIFRRFGGGGHQRVASVYLSSDGDAEARRVLDGILSAMREEVAQGG